MPRKASSALPQYDRNSKTGHENLVFLSAIDKIGYGKWAEIITELNSNDTHTLTKYHSENSTHHLLLEKKFENLKKCKLHEIYINLISQKQNGAKNSTRQSTL